MDLSKFNPFAIAKAAVSGIVGAARVAGKAKAAYLRAIDDTDGDNIPQYQEILAGVHALIDRLRGSSVPLVVKQFGELKVEVLELAKIADGVFNLSVELFGHVMDGHAAAIIASEITVLPPSEETA